MGNGNNQKMNTFAAVIPAYDPGPIICSVVSAVSKQANFVVIVDDGSSAENKKFIKQCSSGDNITVITFDKNMGKGYALIEGIKESLQRNPDYILTIDSDGQHDPSEIPKFKECISLARGHCDLVIGERKKMEKMPFRSRLGNVITSNILNAVFGGPVTDTQSGFRAYSAGFARDIISHIPPGRYETEMRILLYALETHRDIRNIEIGTIYLDKNRNSKFRPVSDSLLVIMAFGRYTIVSFTSFLLDYGIFLALSYIFDVYYIYAHVMSRTISAAFNFLSNKHFVFRSKKSTLHEIPKYVLAVLFSLSVTSVLLYCLVDIFSFPRFVAKPLIESVMFLINFLVQKRFVFHAVYGIRGSEDSIGSRDLS
jgi:glycosyltransferase involved in cell wall biosynthesis